MVKILFITLADGKRYEVEAQTGQSVMQTAIGAAVPRIIGECGGACCCATCHVYVDGKWSDRLGAPGMLEADMLTLADNLTPASRLACQIEVDESLDGLVVYVP